MNWLQYAKPGHSIDLCDDEGCYFMSGEIVLINHSDNMVFIKIGTRTGIFHQRNLSPGSWIKEYIKCQ